MVDATFTTPVLMRPLEWGADLVIHSVTKYIAGHGDVLGGAILGKQDTREIVEYLYRTLGPNLGPFTSFSGDAWSQDSPAADGEDSAATRRS